MLINPFFCSLMAYPLHGLKDSIPVIGSGSMALPYLRKYPLGADQDKRLQLYSLGENNPALSSSPVDHYEDPTVSSVSAVKLASSDVHRQYNEKPGAGPIQRTNRGLYSLSVSPGPLYIHSCHYIWGSCLSASWLSPANDDLKSANHRSPQYTYVLSVCGYLRRSQETHRREDLADHPLVRRTWASSL